MGSFHRRTFSYDKLPSEPIRLSVLKLDGSSFDVYVTSSATVGDLKLAIETAFSHIPKKGPSKISWSHVWGHFCLCFGSQKLVTDTDCIGSYGMKDGDELRFKNHVSGNAVLSKGYSRKSKQKNLERLGPEDENEQVTSMVEIDDDQYSWDDDLEKGSFVRYKDDNVVDTSSGETRSCLSNVRVCCFALGFKELFGFSNDRAYYSLRDTWRDD
ncbi:U11/U12 small nuclear ribonucleoprotein 25 kDa protein [Cardamine amara subsp. amara]|uniref:U11/U12 small nuclear ribonucleoprotein 25 kDa protein n=1 Tax=Cardamine amara subsp. amara TaxID=228776 RepID=A0ABD1B731_CARAN